MQELLLNKGFVALVDDDVFEAVARFSWSALAPGGYIYAARWEKRRLIYLHREVMQAVSGVLVDHVDRNTLNNQRHNLRTATRAQNAANQKLSGRSSSGYKGVTWRNLQQKWCAGITIAGKPTYLGLFRDPIEAALAYDKAAIEVFGEFAQLNFPA